MPKFALGRCRFLFLWLISVPVFLKSAEPVSLELIKKIPHSGYSEGLDFHENFLWNATPKIINKIDPKDGTVAQSFKPATEYSESISWFKGFLWNVSFTDNSIHSGKLDARGGIAFTKQGTVPEIHAWGLCHDGKNLVMTGDYSNKLYFYDAKSVKLVRTLVTEGKDLEDLAWDGKVFWTSSFTVHPGEIFAIDPSSGKVKGYFAIPEKEKCPVIDGIAYDGKGLWITGKECPSIWYVKLPKGY